MNKKIAAKNNTGLTLHGITGSLRNDLRKVEKKWDNYIHLRIANAGRENFTRALQTYYKLRPNPGRINFNIGDLTQVHDSLHSHRRYTARLSIEKILDVIIDLRLLRWNTERFLRALARHTTDEEREEKLIILQNDVSTWREIISDNFTLVENSPSASPLFMRTLCDVLWRCISSAIMIANFVLERADNNWSTSLRLNWRRVDASELATYEASDSKGRLNKGLPTSGSKDLDDLLSSRRHMYNLLESDKIRKKSPFPWDEESESDDKKRGVKVKFDDEASVITSDGNITVQIINPNKDSHAAPTPPPIVIDSPRKATYLGSYRDSDYKTEYRTININKGSNGRRSVELELDDDSNDIVVIRTPRQDTLFPRIIDAPLITRIPKMTTPRVLITEVPDANLLTTRDLRNMINKLESKSHI